MQLPPPAPGRDCGDCVACCVDLAIAELDKPDGVRCRNLAAGGGCAIYETRPATCRTWFCGWRLLTSFSDAMRPDRSGVMLVPEIGQTEGYRKGGLMIVPVNGDVAGVGHPELIDFAGRCVAAGVPIYLSYGVGEACRRLLVNPLLEPAARAGDRADFVRRMHQLTDEMVAEVEAQSQARTPAAETRRWESGPIRIDAGARTMGADE
jgi:hypothetical protein